MIRKPFYSLLLLVFMLFLQSCAPTLEQAKKHYDSGLRNYLSGEHYDAAESDFKQSAATGFYLPGVYASIGIMHVKNGDVPGGIEFLEKEYELYGDPLIKHYMDFLKERFGINNVNEKQGE